jgi:hypothetical protein
VGTTTTTGTGTSIRAPLALAGGAPPARGALLLLVLPGPGGRRGGGAHGARRGRVGGHRPTPQVNFSIPSRSSSCFRFRFRFRPPSIWLTSPWATRAYPTFFRRLWRLGRSRDPWAAGTSYTTVPPSPWLV